MPNDTVEIPQNLNWICSQKGQFFIRKVLKTINNRGNEGTESSVAQTLLSKTFQNDRNVDKDKKFHLLTSCNLISVCTNFQWMFHT
jgi:hypothetical protein